MINKEELLKLLFYFIAAITASVIRFLRIDKKNFSLFMGEMLLGASFAFFLVPAAVEYFHLTMYMATAITWIVTMFSEIFISRLRKYFTKKIDDVTNTNN